MLQSSLKRVQSLSEASQLVSFLECVSMYYTGVSVNTFSSVRIRRNFNQYPHKISSCLSLSPQKRGISGFFLT